MIWNYTNIGASASIQNLWYVRKIFDYMGYASEADISDADECQYAFKYPPVYYCKSSDSNIDEQIHAVAELEDYDIKDLCDLLNALFPRTWLFVRSVLLEDDNAWESHERVYDTDNMTCHGLDRYIFCGESNPYEPDTSWKMRFSLEPPKMDYVQALINISKKNGNADLTKLLLELAQKLRNGEIVYIENSSDPRKINEIYDVEENDEADQYLPSKYISPRELADQYIIYMKAACAAGKSVSEMIERARDFTESCSEFDFAVQNLNLHADISFHEKHFILGGFGLEQMDVVEEIKKRGGIVDRAMTKECDYLIVRLDDYVSFNVSSSISKAVELQENGASTQIITDYQFWQAIY